MDTIELPHDTATATLPLSRPIDIDDPHDADPGQHAAFGPVDDGGDPSSSASPTGCAPVSEPRKGRGQAVLFGTTALLVVTASAGVIFHKPLLSAWSRLRAQHAVLASTVPLPKPRSATSVLGAADARHQTAKPIDNAVPGLAVLPGANHPLTAGSADAPSSKPRAAMAPEPSQKPTQAFVTPAAATIPESAQTARGAPEEAAISQKPTFPPLAGRSATPGPAPNAPASTPAIMPAVVTVPHDPLVGPIPPKGTLQSIPHPVQAAAKLVAAPASRVDEVQTNSLVAALGRLIAELRSQNLAMQTEIAALRQHVDTRMTSFNQRLTFDQAHDALALAGLTRPAPASTSAAARDASPDLQSTQVFPVSRTPMPPVSPAAYHIQAASTGLAMIVRNGTTYEVSVGSVVPGVGRVISIVEEGASWIVRTDHGVIR